jgi:hypothetical protein
VFRLIVSPKLRLEQEDGICGPTQMKTRLQPCATTVLIHDEESVAPPQFAFIDPPMYR